MQDQHHATRAEVERLSREVADKERENVKLWEQMRSAAHEYHQVSHALPLSASLIHVKFSWREITVLQKKCPPRRTDGRGLFCTFPC